MSQERGVRSKHRDLHAWQRAIELVKVIYRITAAFPDSERFGLTAQMRRAAVSVPSNIAEGAARTTTREFLHFLGIARGPSANSTHNWSSPRSSPTAGRPMTWNSSSATPLASSMA